MFVGLSFDVFKTPFAMLTNLVYISGDAAYSNELVTLSGSDARNERRGQPERLARHALTADVDMGRAAACGLARPTTFAVLV